MKTTLKIGDKLYNEVSQAWVTIIAFPRIYRKVAIVRYDDGTRIDMPVELLAKYKTVSAVIKKEG